MQTLKYGSKGEQVSQLQHLLISHGAKIVKDGDFGEMTEKAVIAYQKSANLIADGIVGVKTWRSLRGDAAANPITQADYDAAAKRLDGPVNVIRAFAKVESNGSGFFADGRPAILFERHVFYRLLKAKRGKVFADRYANSHPNIVNAKTGGYKGGTSEWVRLQFALTIDADCAYQSASWGAFQIMGENWQTLGYESIDDFVAQMHAGESYHLDAFLRFCETKRGLLDALRKADWHKVFTLYNGRNYQKMGYDFKFLRELRRLESIA